jgi:hypothetical protein
MRQVVFCLFFWRRHRRLLGIVNNFIPSIVKNNTAYNRGNLHFIFLTVPLKSAHKVASVYQLPPKPEFGQKPFWLLKTNNLNFMLNNKINDVINNDNI